MLQRWIYNTDNAVLWQEVKVKLTNISFISKIRAAIIIWDFCADSMRDELEIRRGVGDLTKPRKGLVTLCCRNSWWRTNAEMWGGPDLHLEKSVIKHRNSSDFELFSIWRFITLCLSFPLNFWPIEILIRTFARTRVWKGPTIGSDQRNVLQVWQLPVTGQYHTWALKSI